MQMAWAGLVAALHKRMATAASEKLGTVVI